MLFLQGTRDEFAGLDLLRPVVDGLGGRGRLTVVGEGDHSFKVPARTGRKPEAVMAELAVAIAAWVEGLGVRG
jgi:hypothetical protein